MTLSHEERAAKVAKIINASGDDHDLITAFGEVVIAQALREACNEKLEEAAAWFEKEMPCMATPQAAAMFIRTFEDEGPRDRADFPPPPTPKEKA